MKEVCVGSKVKVVSVDNVDILKGIAVGDTGVVAISDDIEYVTVLMDKDHLVAFISINKIAVL